MELDGDGTSRMARGNHAPALSVRLGDIAPGFSQPGAGCGVGERAPHDDAHGQADDDRQVDDRAASHARRGPPAPAANSASAHSSATLPPITSVGASASTPPGTARLPRFHSTSCPTEAPRGPRRMQDESPGSETELRDGVHRDELHGKPRAVPEGVPVFTGATPPPATIKTPEEPRNALVDRSEMRRRPQAEGGGSKGLTSAVPRSRPQLACPARDW